MRRRATNRPAVTIPCKVSRGMFSTERGVSIVLPDGTKRFILADQANVIVSREPEPGGEVDGRLRVSLVDLTAHSATIDLPAPDIAQGTRLEVPRTFLVR